MTATSLWKEYRMGGAEREFLDHYLEGRKRTAAPSEADEIFFSKFCIAQILKPRDLDIDQLASGYTDGRHDGGADAIYFFVQGKLVSDEMKPSDVTEFEGLTMSLQFIQATRTAGFNNEQIRKLEDLGRDLMDLRNDVDAKAHLYNYEVRLAIKRFRTWWQELRMKLPSLTITFHIASKGDAPHPDVEARSEVLKKLLKDMYPCECEIRFYTAKMLLEMAKQSRRSPVELTFVHHLASAQGGNAYVCLVRIKDYIPLITTETGDLRDYVLEPNVRGYLGEKGVNAEILNTLLSGKESQEFWWLNNGVTITSSKITPGITSLVLNDARVVNGLQTSREIYNYFQQKRKAALTDERQLLVKVIEAEPKIARNITKTTNNQTKVDAIYLRTTIDELHDRIEQSLPNFGYHYERAKNQYYDDESIPQSQIVTLDYLTRALVAILMQHPEQARGSPAQFVRRHYSRIFSHSSKPEVFGHTVQVMKKVDEFINSRVEAKTDRANLKYYVAMDVVCSVIKKGSIQRSAIAKLKLEKITPEVLDGSLIRTRKIYEKLLARGIVPDLVAKGADFIAELRKELEAIHPPKKANLKLLFSGHSQ